MLLAGKRKCVSSNTVLENKVFLHDNFHQKHYTTGAVCLMKSAAFRQQNPAGRVSDFPGQKS
jgi:hypothetical protein